MSVEDIQRAVCHHFHLRSIDLTSKDRHKSVAFARHVAMYLCKALTHGIEIREVVLLAKSGGKRDYKAPGETTA